jgi:hypothetical protein
MRRYTTLNIVGPFSRRLTNFQNTRCPEQAGHYYLSFTLSLSASSRDFSHKPSSLVHHKYLFVTASHLHIMVWPGHTAHHHSHCLICPPQYLVFPLAQLLGTTLMLEIVCSSKTVVLTYKSTLYHIPKEGINLFKSHYIPWAVVICSVLWHMILFNFVL